MAWGTPMRHLPTILLCLLLPPLAVAAAPQLQEQGRSIPYQKLYAPLAAVRQADPTGVVSSSLRAEAALPGQSLPADLKIELRSGTTHQPLTLDKDGAFALPLRADWASGDATVWINHPKEEIKVVEIFKMRTPTATRISYAQLMESVPVMERIQQQHADIGDLMASTPQGIELAYQPGTPQTVTVGSGAQRKTWNTDDKGHVRIPFDPALPAAAPVVLSALPVALQPYAD
jgi:hypothetical protein